MHNLFGKNTQKTRGDVTKIICNLDQTTSSKELLGLSRTYKSPEWSVVCGSCQSCQTTSTSQFIMSISQSDEHLCDLYCFKNMQKTDRIMFI